MHGSVKEVGKKVYGGHSYLIQKYDNDEDKIIGYGATSLTDKMPSTTTEQYGVLSILLILNALYKIHGNTDQLYPITIISDSKETVKRINDKE